MPALLKSLRTLEGSLPSEQQRADLDAALAVLADFVANLRSRLAGLPTREQTTEAARAVSELEAWLSVAQTNPALRSALGLPTPTHSHGPHAQTRDLKSDGASSLLKEMDGWPVDRIRAWLGEEQVALADLRALAAQLGVPAADRSSRDTLSQQLAPKIANYNSYWRLGSHGEIKG